MSAPSPRQCAGKALYADKDEDIVIVSALRTPICKARRGGFKVKCINNTEVNPIFFFNLLFGQQYSLIK